MFSAKNLTLGTSARIRISLVCLAASSLLTSASLAAPEPSTNTTLKTPAKTSPADKEKDKKDTAKTPEPVLENVVAVSTDELVNKPHEFLGRNVKFTANFFAFSNLALDYKPALRTSKTHLSFLVLKNGSHVPLSELKLAMMIPKEKDPETQLLQALKDGDQVEIVGKQFSAAMDDPWVEVFKLKKIGGSKEKDKKTAAAADAKKETEKAAQQAPDKAPDKTPKSETKTDKEKEKP